MNEQRNAAFDAYAASIRANNLTELELENIRADFFAGWDANLWRQAK